MKQVVWLLFLFNGRLNRKGYWILFGPLLLLSILNGFDIIGGIIVLALGLIKGTDGENNYGNYKFPSN
jgi:uncharacterized membrane protein YhaH (DUF805 family)